MKPIINKNQIVQQFIDLVLQGTKSLADAGALIAQAIDEHGEDIIEQVCDKCPDMTPEFVKRLESVGRKHIHPALIINEGPGVRRLRGLPFSLQEKYSKDPLPLLVLTDDGVETMQADVRNLTPSQACQVIAKDRIRSEAEQRAYIEDQRAKATVQTNNSPFRILKDTLVICEPCKLSRKELAGILSDMS